MGNPPGMPGTPGTQWPGEGRTSTSSQPLVRTRHIVLSWSSDVVAVCILSLPDCSRELAELQDPASCPAIPGRRALSGRSRHRPALRGRARRRMFPACCNLSAPLTSSPSPQLSAGRWAPRAAPLPPAGPPSSLQPRSPPGAPTPGGSAPGPTDENRKSIRKGNTGGGPACTQSQGPASSCARCRQPDTAHRHPPRRSPTTPAQGESPNALPADPHPPRLR